MDDHDDPAIRRRYTWPWFVLGAFLLGVALAILWVSAEVRRTREHRESNTLPGQTATNSPATNRF